MKTLSTCALLLALFFNGFSQEDYIVPDYNLKIADDYKPLELEVIKAYEWLMESPASIKHPLRKDASKFVLEWIMGSPYVTVELHDQIITFMDNSECLVIFLGAWNKLALEKRDINNIDGNIAGLEAMILFYTKNKVFLGEDKNIEKYVKLKEKGKLKSFIESKLKY